jgi:GT2 family glycosyltransferase
MHELSVSIIIPNYNGEQLLKENLPKVINSAKKCEIIVIDDGSTDQSQIVLEKFSNIIRLLHTPKQLGFASAVNRGVNAATGDIIVLLNTDVVPDPSFLPPLISHFKNPHVFAVGALEISHEDGGLVKRGRGIAQWAKGFYIHERGEVNAQDTAWVSGGSGAFRKSLWIQLGGMDEIYNPFYWEDIDLSYRARKSGYLTLFESNSIVHHYHQSGAINQKYSPSFVKQIAYRNQFVFVWKNLSTLSMFWAHVFWTKIRLVQAIFRGDWDMIQGFILAIGKIPDVISKRNGQKRFWILSDSTL